MTKMEQFKKFVKEHKTEIAAGCLAVVSVGLGVVAYRTTFAVPKLEYSREEAEKAVDALITVCKHWEEASSGADSFMTVNMSLWRRYERHWCNFLR